MFLRAFSKFKFRRFYSTQPLFRILNKSSCKTYLIGCPLEKKCALIDPIASRIDGYVGLLGYYGYNLQYIIDTHSHADHKTASFELKNMIQESQIVMHKNAPAPFIDKHVDDGDVLRIGASLDLKVIHTPGHTPDSISLYGAGRVFTGDCLMIGGCGRTDFAGGDAEEQYNSVTNKLFKLPDDTLVYPGHDYRGNTVSTIGQEKQSNPRLKLGTTKEQFIKIMENLNLPLPKSIQEVLQPNQSAIDYELLKFPSYDELVKVTQLTTEEVKDLMKKESPVIVDVREKEEFASLPPLKDCIHIPLRHLPQRAKELAQYKDRPIVFVCRAGVRSTTAAALVNEMNLGLERVYNMKGGMLKWYDMERRS